MESKATPWLNLRAAKTDEIRRRAKAAAALQGQTIQQFALAAVREVADRELARMGRAELAKDSGAAA